MPLTAISAGTNAFTGLLNTGLGIANTFLQQHNNNRNYELQKEVFEYQKALQQQIFDREDTAVQRRKADLIAAGMSPLLAAGSGANSGLISPVQAPQSQMAPLPNVDGLAQGLNNSLSNILESQKTGAEVDYLRSQAKYISENEKTIQHKIKLMQQQLKNTQLDEAFKNLNVQEKTALLKFGEKMGVPYQFITPEVAFASMVSSAISETAGDILNAINPIISEIPILGSLWNKINLSEKVDVLNSAFSVFSVLFGQRYVHFKIKNGRIERDYQHEEKLNQKQTFETKETYDSQGNNTGTTTIHRRTY